VIKQTQPVANAMHFVILTAFDSSKFGRNGRIKSSRTSSATEFKPLDRELLNVDPSYIYYVLSKGNIGRRINQVHDIM